MHKPSLWKSIDINFPAIISLNNNIDLSQQITLPKRWWNLAVSSSKPDLHNINALAKFHESPFIFTCTQVIIQKWKYGWMALLQTDGLMDSQRETIIPCHYPVAGYKKNICCVYLGVKRKSCVSANMLKKILSVGRRNFFFFLFPYFFSRKEQGQACNLWKYRYFVECRCFTFLLCVFADKK